MRKNPVSDIQYFFMRELPKRPLAILLVDAKIYAANVHDTFFVKAT